MTEQRNEGEEERNMMAHSGETWLSRKHQQAWRFMFVQ